MQVVHAGQGFEQTVAFVPFLLTVVGDSWWSVRGGGILAVPRVNIWVTVLTSSSGSGGMRSSQMAVSGILTCVPSRVYPVPLNAQRASPLPTDDS